MSKYVKIDDVMALINTSNRGNCDYFIVDKIEELCSSSDIYDVEKVVTELENLRNCSDFGTCNHCQNRWCPMELLEADEVIRIVKNGGN